MAQFQVYLSDMLTKTSLAVGSSPTEALRSGYHRVVASSDQSSSSIADLHEYH